MRRSLRMMALTLVATAGTAMLSPAVILASESGKKNTAIALGAATLYLLTKKNKTPAIAAGIGTAIAYSQYQKEHDQNNDRDAWRYRSGSYNGYDNRYGRDGYDSRYGRETARTDYGRRQVDTRRDDRRPDYSSRDRDRDYRSTPVPQRRDDRINCDDRQNGRPGGYRPGATVGPLVRERDSRSGDRIRTARAGESGSQTRDRSSANGHRDRVADGRDFGR